ncbi:MAG: hypothetical protein KAU41_03780, partial [Deltaproteobacteria bacterium]|nr:hypothetical protein [Deltaproteobacteria bacterium]
CQSISYLSEPGYPLEMTMNLGDQWGTSYLTPVKLTMGDVATIPLFLNRKGAKDAKVVFLFFS